MLRLKRNNLGDIWFHPGSRLRISCDIGLNGPFAIWIRWGWKAEWQFAITKRVLIMIHTPRRGWLLLP